MGKKISYVEGTLSQVNHGWLSSKFTLDNGQEYKSGGQVDNNKRQEINAMLGRMVKLLLQEDYGEWKVTNIDLTSSQRAQVTTTRTYEEE
jgi:hypothetical protein